MNLDLTPGQVQARDLARELARTEWGPASDAWEKDGAIPDAVMARAAERGVLAMAVPEAHGGTAADSVAAALVIEEAARASASLALCMVHHAMGCWAVAASGTPEQQRRYLPRMARGMLGAFCLSEPEAGSDASALATTAARDGDSYVLRGTKGWVANGGRGGLFVVFAATDRSAGAGGVSAFLVERGTPGLVPGKRHDTLGLRAADVTEVDLEDCRVPAGNRLGPEDQALGMVTAALDVGRVGIAALALGLSEAAFERAVRFSQARQAQGQPLSGMQSVQWMIADMARRIESARWLVYRAAWLRDQGQPFSRQAAMAKVCASEAATLVTHRAIQVHGARGCLRENLVERHYRDARALEIDLGPSEVERQEIARSMLEGGVSGMI